MAAARSKGTYLAARYARLAPKRGKRRARKAIGHSILIGVWHILADDHTSWNELGADYFERSTSCERPHACEGLRTPPPTPEPMPTVGPAARLVASPATVVLRSQS